MSREEYIKRAWNAIAIKVGSVIESGHDNMWALIDDYIKAGIEEAYDKGYDVGYNEAMNTASYEFDRERGYL